MEESTSTIICITLSGGFQDAYSYFARGKVFSNAQTGNIVLMASHLASGDLLGVIRYLMPLIFFCVGVFAAEQFEGRYVHSKNFHWRQKVLLFETVLLILSGFLPESWNIFVTSMLSFACAMQVQAFRKWNGNAYASTMCIGNMRNSMSFLSSYTRTKNKKDLHTALWYFTVNAIFFCGAGLGYLCVQLFALHAIWVSCAFLLLGMIFLWNFNTSK